MNSYKALAGSVCSMEGIISELKVDPWGIWFIDLPQSSPSHLVKLPVGPR